MAATLTAHEDLRQLHRVSVAERLHFRAFTPVPAATARRGAARNGGRGRRLTQAPSPASRPGGIGTSDAAADLVFDAGSTRRRLIAGRIASRSGPRMTPTCPSRVSALRQQALRLARSASTRLRTARLSIRSQRDPSAVIYRRRNGLAGHVYTKWKLRSTIGRM